ncbi:MAG: tetratricopeptide repeat protein [Acidobacteria bacterium]|nr:tetratricopeptide repeat protein [Acidobacteriota bacterium]
MLVLAIAMGALPTTISAQAPDRRVSSITAALRDENYELALQLIRAALADSPASSELWTMQGVAFKGSNRPKEALASFRKALKLSPNNMIALRGAAQIAVDQGDAAGIPILEHILKLDPNDRTSHAMVAVLEYQQGDCTAALPHFEKAASVFEQRPAGLRAYAACLVKQKRFDDAIAVFSRTLEADPENAQERRVLAAVQLMGQHPEAAITTISPLLSATPDPQTLELASQAYEQAHETEKAVDYLRQAILLNPNDVNLYLEFAAIAEKHQSLQVGINVVNDGINLQPEAAALYFARGMLYVQLSEYDKAQSDFDRAYQLDPKSSLSAAAQGLTAVQQNDFTKALAGIQEKLRTRPNDPILLYMQADILTEQDPKPGSTEFNTALNSARRAVALKPSLGPAHAVLAKLYMSAEHYPEAVRESRKAFQADPADQTALYHLVRALRKTDQKGEIPGLLKQLAVLRQQANSKKREENRVKLVEGEPEVR